MQTPKIQFSPNEIELMINGAWILTKNSALRKMAEGMGLLAERMKQTVMLKGGQLVGVVTGSNAKISKGENYQGLPYLMLDYPRIFGKEDILAIRTFFWWGKFCSVTLHVKGKYRELICKNISSATATLVEHGFYYSAKGEEWNHDVMSADYERITDASSKDFVLRLFHSPFNKFSAKIELSQWNEMEEKLFEKFEVLIRLFD